MTEYMRNRAYEMISTGDYTNCQIARRCRISEQSVVALKANYTRGWGLASEYASSSN